ncbi:DUF108 domain-containing protein [Omnitrophica bacterium]|nr:DUF108 domain-containing protein [Candidatus Omnitrophota bacterium]
MEKITVGIIGCGTLGSELAKFLFKKFSKQMSLRFVCDRDPQKILRIKKSFDFKIQSVSFDALIRKSDLIIETASADAAARVAQRALLLNKKALILSVGGLLKIPNLFSKIRASKGRLWIPSGAIAGVDGLAAAKEGRISRVRLVTRKPPRGLNQAPYFKRHAFPKISGKKASRIFKGTARQAVRDFPQNINVAAVLSLAGIGAAKTEVEIWTSHQYHSNCHEVLIEGNFGTIRAVTDNKPSPQNPKTSYLAALSAMAVLREIFSSIEVGT